MKKKDQLGHPLREHIAMQADLEPVCKPSDPIDGHTQAQEPTEHAWWTDKSLRLALYNASETVMRHVVAQFGPAHHQLESYDKFINTILERIFFEEPVRTIQRGHNLYVLEVCGFRIVGPTHQEPNGIAHAIFPAEAHLRLLNYDLKPLVTFSYRTYHKETQPDQSIRFRLVKEELCEANVGLIPCQKMSRFCHLYRTGAMAHEDPYAPDGTFYYYGTEKYFESHTQLRSNYPYVFKRNEDIVSVQCDYHTSSEFFHRHTCAVHFYLVDQTPKHRHAFATSSKRSNLFDPIVWQSANLNSRAHSSHGEEPNVGMMPPCDQYVSIALPNIKYFNFTLVALLFLMGLSDRSVMIRLLHHACDDRRVQDFITKMIMTQTVVVAPKPKMRRPRDVQENRDTNDDEMLDGWTRADLIDHYAKLIAVKLPMSKTVMVQGHPVVLNAHQNAVDRLRRSFTEELLPNVGVDVSLETMQSKMVHIAHIVVKMVLVHLNLISPDVQDHASMKVINMVGSIMTKNYRLHFMDALRHMHDHILKSRDRATPPSLKMIIESKFHKNPMLANMGNNNWATVRGGRLMGLTQELVSITPATMNESMRTIKTIVDKRSKLKELHQLDGSQQGFVCKYHTPADSNIGLKTYLTQTPIVRQGYQTSMILNVLFSNLEHYACKPLLLCDDNDLQRGVPIVIHAIEAYSLNPQKTLDALLADRRLSILPIDLGITWVGGPTYPGGPLLDPYQNYISIRADVGAAVRPLLVADRLVDMLSIVHQHGHMHRGLFDRLIESGIVEYLDPETIKTRRIADRIDTYLDAMATQLALHRPTFQWQGDIRQYQSWTKQIPHHVRHAHFAKAPYTHIEISDMTSMGWVAALQAFTSHNHSNRNIFNAGMMTQVIGSEPLNSKYKVRGTVNTLLTPTCNQPTASMSAQQSAMDLSVHGGQTRTVAIMCDPYNAEDGTSHVRPDFGFGHHLHKTWVRSMVKIQQSKGKDPTSFQRPDHQTYGRKSSCYDHLHDDGRPKLGALIHSGAAVIGKVFKVAKMDPRTNTKIVQHRDKSELNRSKHAQRVDAIIETTDSTGRPIIHVAMSNMHVPMLGDKMILPHGQKGVVSRFYGRDEMPYFVRKETGVCEGIDMLFNPHGIPSRSTVGPIAEALHEQLWRHDETWMDQPWQRASVADQMDRLTSLGLKSCGKHMVVHGLTGQMVEAHIFVGQLNLQLLSHKAAIKYKSRNMGPKYYKTQQPVGSGHGGNSGNRTGEMEALDYNAHGALHIMNQALFTASDPSMVFACAQCGMLAEPPKAMHARINKMVPMEVGAYCRICRSWDHVVCLSMPHISQLIIRENYAQGIAWRLKIQANHTASLPNNTKKPSWIFSLDDVSEEQRCDLDAFDPAAPPTLPKTMHGMTSVEAHPWLMDINVNDLYVSFVERHSQPPINLS